MPQKRSCFGIQDRALFWPRGKVLGGSSTLNYMLYIRGNRQDYNNWERSGAHGWSYEDVLPYFIKSEDNRDLDVAFNGYHGRGGPLTVQRSTWIGQLTYAFLEAAKMFGYPVLDANAENQNGFLIPQSTIRRGHRCSTAKAFLYSVRHRKNLHVVTFAYVTKILFNQYKEAIGVVFDRFGERHKVFARKEIILSGGSINSPQLLMLSGK